MPKLKIIHAADIHFDNDADILQEVIACSGFMAAHAEKIRPHAIVIAGDLTDQRLLMDSPARSRPSALSGVCPPSVRSWSSRARSCTISTTSKRYGVCRTSWR